MLAGAAIANGATELSAKAEKLVGLCDDLRKTPEAKRLPYGLNEHLRNFETYRDVQAGKTRPVFQVTLALYNEVLTN